MALKRVVLCLCLKNLACWAWMRGELVPPSESPRSTSARYAVGRASFLVLNVEEAEGLFPVLTCCACDLQKHKA